MSPDDGDWTRVSLWRFIRGPVLHTPEGWVMLLGTTVSVCFAALEWVAPGWVSASPGTATGEAILFALWPLALFTAYIMFCAPEFEPGLFSAGVMIASAALPFWMVYGP